MRFVSYMRNGQPGVGELDGDRVVPLGGIAAIGPEVGTVELTVAPRLASSSFPLADAQLLPASPRPARILCIGLNYQSHIDETRRDLPEYPVLFPKFASNLIGAGDPIRLPPESQQVDYEAELAVVIGVGGRRISEESALDHVLGYTVANDVTMRDFQYKTHQWLQGKAWDASTPLGPAIVTPDEVDVTAASIRTVLNGRTLQESTLDRLIFSVPRLIATISVFTALQPGDVILTGTPGGVGFRREPQVFLQEGDEVVVEVEGVGRIASRVVAEDIQGG